MLATTHALLASNCTKCFHPEGPLPPNLIHILRMTIARLEEEAELGPDDSALAEIKKNLLRVDAELELSKTVQAEGAALPAGAREAP